MHQPPDNPDPVDDWGRSYTDGALDSWEQALDDAAENGPDCLGQVESCPQNALTGCDYIGRCVALAVWRRLEEAGR